MLQKKVNEWGKDVYRGVTVDTPLSDLEFHSVEMPDGDQQWALHTDLGSLTVVDRMTGFGHRDIETGYCDTDGKFWLASGGFDVRRSGCESIGDAIEWVKNNANTCVGV